MQRYARQSRQSCIMRFEIFGLLPSGNALEYGNALLTRAFPYTKDTRLWNLDTKGMFLRQWFANP